jgi:dTDP-4-dehydrorhamnose reductase
MRLLVTGAKGMLGQRLVADGEARGHEMVGTDLPELDLTSAQDAFDFVGETRPDAIVHCAAYTDVDGAEADEMLALRVNMEGASHVAAAGGLNGAFVVVVSTDYVFAGDAARPYVESDIPAPQTAYGRTKLLGERAVAESGADHAIARTAWLYGAGGKNFVDTMLALAADRDEVSVVDDQVGCPTWTGHLSPALLELVGRREGGIHHLAGAGQCSWAGFAEEIFARTGVSCAVRRVTSEEFVRPARRPAWSVLASERDDPITLPAWEAGLDGYLEERTT